MNHLFCFGLGYSATFLARQLLAKGWRITGTCRSRDTQVDLSRLGIEAHLFDRDHRIGNLSALLEPTTHLLSSVPPDEGGDPVLDLHRAEIDAVSQRLNWIGYLSTTGVYGDRNGGWVDEMSELKPSGERGRRRAAAEAGWLALSQPAHLFRLAGIYGPGSSALDTVREGRAKRIVKSGQIFSRIHVADIARVLEASMARPHPGAAYNVCDDDPAPPSDVIAFAAALLNVPPPPEVPFEQADLSAMARSFYEDNKRVSNSRIKRELGVALQYPSYRVGLPAIVAAGGQIKSSSVSPSSVRFSARDRR
jgi:nucleoside-diphosphate-sugar epimerase